ncbi:transcriptional regulator [Actinoplanes lobatus]|uniref:GAF domain-containing protein n=1 Tax=Actinoplanes lobatus TaxID=113568 RepID=A0A7W7HBY6_9ACTN|nr:GAF and ANTAR domain-containing protein [Actinoplanes lobatus]MBB4747704.1 GAF domain-containing protein [Actinoplanes lobatus]GGN73259.1 transcriptional regulator [Actinoplanes lobatus]GIE39731.1 transcriptional regulator [Actinoplanes lobatus]
MSTVSAERLATIFVEAADTLVDEFDLLDFMHMLVDRARVLVDAAAAGLMLADERGRLEFMAGSDENVRLVELFQLQNDQGPCLEAFRTGRSVINVDLASAVDRWPRFAPRAAEAGFRSVHAFPLRLRTQVIGALNIFGSSAGGDFDPTDVPVMQALADVATIGLMQERAIRRSEALTEQLQGALNSRIIIEQAKGALAQILGVSVDEAFRRIRAYARNHNRRLTEVCELIVTDLARLPGLTQP